METDWEFIDTQESLAESCAAMGESGAIAIDTEFVRERTYFPRLCVVQVASRDRILLLDVLGVSDLDPLRALLTDPNVEKILHSGRQDCEAFHHTLGVLPAPMTDTQIAADLAGMGDQSSYAAVVEQILGVTLEKGQTRTDWAKRPLDPAQLDYAADDVRYLLALSDRLAEKLALLGRDTWLEAESRLLTDPRLYEVQAGNAWRRVKGAGRLEGKTLAALQRLAAWREDRAVAADKPRQWILKDPVLVALATVGATATGESDLARIPDLSPGIVKRHGNTLVDLVQPREGDRDAGSNRPGIPDADQRRVTKKLMAALREHAARAGISPGLIANRRDLEGLAAGLRDVPVLTGWRREIAGEALLAILDQDATSQRSERQE